MDLYKDRRDAALAAKAAAEAKAAKLAAKAKAAVKAAKAKITRKESDNG